MAYNNLIISLFVIIVSSLIDHGATLDSELIHGGHFARSQSLKYHVGVLSRTHVSDPYVVICAGSIISDFFVISAIRCFLNTYLQIVDILYSVVANTTDFNNIKKSDEIPVVTIYTSLFDVDSSLNDIAILKLSQSLKLERNPYITKVDLPSDYKSFGGRYGVVSGYGCATPDESSNSNSGNGPKHKRTFSLNIKSASPQDLKHRRTFSGIKETEEFEISTPTKQAEVQEVFNNILKYGIVKIFYDNDSTRGLQNIDRRKQFYGSIIPHKQGQKTGICQTDTGGPLVVENTLVGIVSEGMVDCSNQVPATTFTQVSYFTHMIRLVLENKIKNVPYRYYRGQHVTHVRL